MAFIAPRSKSIRISIGNLPLVKFDMAIIKLMYKALVLLRQQKCKKRFYHFIAREKCTTGRIPMGRP